MYRFNWKEIDVTPLTEIMCTAADIQAPAIKDEIGEKITSILEAAGGPGLVENTVNDQAVRAIAEGLLEDALRTAFAGNSRSHESEGHYLKSVTGQPYSKKIELHNIVHVNYATAEQLEELPVLGKALAADIIRERTSNGMFTGAMDLAKRVDGLGDKSAQALIPFLRFRNAPGAHGFARDLKSLVEQLVGREGSDKPAALRQVLDYTLTYTRRKSDGQWFGDRQYAKKLRLKKHTGNWLGVLEEQEYYYWLLDAIKQSKKSIDVAMFHIAMPSGSHPTHKLIDALIDARKRKVKVRVLMDNDRTEDPYKSTVINEAAFKKLKDGGVSVRFDAADHLLHSKFILIDGNTVVMGSHNWSAGSYFHYRDVGVVIESETAWAEMKDRFDKLWNM